MEHETFSSKEEDKDSAQAQLLGTDHWKAKSCIYKASSGYQCPLALLPQTPGSSSWFGPRHTIHDDSWRIATWTSLGPLRVNPSIPPGVVHKNAYSGQIKYPT